MIRVALAVALGGAVGSVLRFLTGSWVVAQWPRHFYLGTFTVNILGCLLIGLLSGLFLLRSDLPIELRSGLIIGSKRRAGKAGQHGGDAQQSDEPCAAVALLKRLRARHETIPP